MRRRPRTFVPATLAILAVVVLALGACAGDDGGGEAGGGDASVAEERQAAQTEGGGGMALSTQDASLGETGESGSPAARKMSAALERVGPSIIKTGDLQLKVSRDDLQDAIQDSIAIASRHGGFVLSTSSERGRFAGGTVTIRVPSSRFERAMGDLEALGKLQNQQVTGEDVGQEFVDLEARLRNWRTQEAVLLRLMDRATSVQDTIRVQSELSGVQLEIERIRGRLNFLEDQTSFATITASFTTGAVPAPNTPNQFLRAWRQAVAIMLAIATGFVTSLGIILPLAAVGLLIWLALRQFRPRLSS